MTKAQKEILAEIIMNDGVVNNYQQRMKAIQPLLDSRTIYSEIVYDQRDGLAIGRKFYIIGG